MSGSTEFDADRPPPTFRVGSSGPIGLLGCDSSLIPDVRGPGYVDWLRTVVDTVYDRAEALSDCQEFRNEFARAIIPHTFKRTNELVLKWGILKNIAPGL